MNPRDTIRIYATIGDMKQVDYTNALAISALVRLLVEKGVFTDDEFKETAKDLDEMPIYARAHS